MTYTTFQTLLVMATHSVQALTQEQKFALYAALIQDVDPVPYSDPGWLEVCASFGVELESENYDTI